MYCGGSKINRTNNQRDPENNRRIFHKGCTTFAMLHTHNTNRENCKRNQTCAFRNQGTTYKASLNRYQFFSGIVELIGIEPIA